jgi:hypothetical protein
MIQIKNGECVLCDNKTTVTAAPPGDWTHVCKKCNAYYDANFYNISYMRVPITYVDQIKDVYKSYMAVYDDKELNFYSHFTERDPYVKLTYLKDPYININQIVAHPMISIEINDDVFLLKKSIIHFKTYGSYHLHDIHNKMNKFNTNKAFL